MPSVQANDIVNNLFSNNKDLSTEVDDAMKSLTLQALEAEKEKIAARWMEPEEEQPETEVTPEEPTDETDKGTD